MLHTLIKSFKGSKPLNGKIKHVQESLFYEGLISFALVWWLWEEIWCIQSYSDQCSSQYGDGSLLITGQWSKLKEDMILYLLDSSILLQHVQWAFELDDIRTRRPGPDWLQRLVVDWLVGLWRILFHFLSSGHPTFLFLLHFASL